MASGATIKKNGLEAIKARMLDKANGLDAIVNRYVFPMYQAAQRQRWMTEGASEGSRWDSLNPDYARQKLRRFAAYPGGGRKMLIATQSLFAAVIVDGSSGSAPAPASKRRRKEGGTRRAESTGMKLVEGGKLIIRISSPYAVYVNQERNFQKFGRQTIDDVKSMIRRQVKRMSGGG